MVKLPEVFLDRMKKMLGDEFEAFLDCYDEAPEKGIRLNTLKCTEGKLLSSFGSELTPSKFSPLSFSAEREIKVGAMPIHSAGAFYSQEPSASSAVTVLAPEKGDKVLDMCAAPGGKSTQIAAYLDGTGLLWSNEVVKSRANILLSNIERMGIRNAVVSSVYPDVLEKKLAGFFDKVLVDAPCSGEGMFRKNPEAITEWSPEHVTACAERQLMILDSAAECLREGGVLVYSTCTFSYEENEGVTKKFLEKHPEFEIYPIEVTFGRKAFDGVPALRIFPMDGGEGHYVARFRRIGGNNKYPEPFEYPKPKSEIKEAQKLFDKISKIPLWGNLNINNDKVMILPKALPSIKGINVLRAGVVLGEVLKNRIEPHHSLYMALRADECKECLDLELDDPRLIKYLHGEEIDCDNNSFTAVAVKGMTVGFGKASGGRLKNRYPKGLRYL